MCMVDINKVYEKELNELYGKLDDLKNNKVAELSNNEADGTLAENVEQIEKMVKRLLHNIEHH